MKIALLFSGLPRYVAKCYPNILQNIIEPNRIASQDIYCHTWLPTAPVSPEYQICQNAVGTYKDIEDIENLYRPSKYQIDKQGEYARLVPRDHLHYPYNYTMQGMCDSIARCKDLLPRLHPYDCLCRIRYDIQFDKKIIFSDYDLDKIHLPAGYNGRITDFFAFGRAWIMSAKYLNIYSYLENLFVDTNVFTPEELFQEHMKVRHQKFEAHQWGQRIYRE